MINKGTIENLKDLLEININGEFNIICSDCYNSMGAIPIHIRVIFNLDNVDNSKLEHLRLQGNTIPDLIAFSEELRITNMNHRYIVGRLPEYEKKLSATNYYMNFSISSYNTRCINNACHSTTGGLPFHLDIDILNINNITNINTIRYKNSASNSAIYLEISSEDITDIPLGAMHVYHNYYESTDTLNIIVSELQNINLPEYKGDEK